MSNELVFAVVDFKISNEQNKDSYWFEVNDIKKLNLNAIIVPLFNTETNDHHDFWDDFVIAEIKIIINLTQTYNKENVIFKEELFSFEALLEEFDSDIHAYQLNMSFDIESVSKQIDFNHTYTINFSYLFEEPETEDEEIFEIIDQNIFFSTIVPFSKDGGWINGWK